MSAVQRTRVVRLREGQQRQQAPNSRTVVLDLQAAGGELPGFHDLFLAHYTAIRELCAGYRRRGLAMIAVDARGVAATACLGAKHDAVNAALVGRHGMCDLYLETDPNLSLRHLVVLLHPRSADGEVRFRLLDLRTAASFADERGRRLEALEAEGALFVRCGAHAIFFFPTSDEDDPWPDDPQAGWECVPERVYLDDAPADPDRWLRRQLKARWGQADEQAADPRSGSGSGRRRRTVVQAIRGPARARRQLLADGDEALGELRIISDDGQSTITVGRQAAREGVLFGRYERCDNDGLAVLANGRISRVHLLLIHIAGGLYAVDTASSNGMWSGDEEARVVSITDGTTLTLGDDLARLTWSTPR